MTGNGKHTNYLGWWLVDGLFSLYPHYPKYILKKWQRKIHAASSIQRASSVSQIIKRQVSLSPLLGKVAAELLPKMLKVVLLPHSWQGGWTQNTKKHMAVSWNRGTPKSSTLMGFSMNQPFGGSPFMETPIWDLVLLQPPKSFGSRPQGIILKGDHSLALSTQRQIIHPLLWVGK